MGLASGIDDAANDVSNLINQKIIPLQIDGKIGPNTRKAIDRAKQILNLSQTEDQKLII